MYLVHGLNPLKREVYAVPFKNQLQIIVGYEVYLKRAAASGLLDGFTVDFTNEQSAGIVATATVYRKGWIHPVVQSVFI